MTSGTLAPSPLARLLPEGWRSATDLRRDDRVFVIILTVLAGVIYWATNPERVELDGFVPLADAFLHGKLHIGPEYGYLEHAPGPDGGGYMPYPPAPVLFSITICWPSARDTGSPVNRARKSVPPPAASMTTTRTGRLG